MSARSDSPLLPTLSPALAALTSELLHDMGQPLTTLQGCHLLPLLGPDERDNLTSEMATQVERLTVLYRELRRLLEVILADNSGAGARPSLLQVLDAAAAKWQREVGRHDVTLVLDIAPKITPSTTVGHHTERALQSVLGTALAHAVTGALLRVVVTDQDQTDLRGVAIEITLEWSRPSSTPETGLPLCARRSLRVAEALLQADGVHMVYNLQPFRATIGLPGAGTLPSH